MLPAHLIARSLDVCIVIQIQVCLKVDVKGTLTEVSASL